MNDELEHAGVKGMKWGRRKAVDLSSRSGSNAPKGNSNLKRNLKIAGGVTAGVALAVGAAYLAKGLNDKGGTSVSNLASNPATAAGKSFMDTAFGSTAARPSAPSAPSGLNLPPRGTTTTPSAPRPSAPRPTTQTSPSGTAGRGPSLDVLSDILGSTPQVRYDPKTGRYSNG